MMVKKRKEKGFILGNCNHFGSDKLIKILYTFRCFLCLHKSQDKEELTKLKKNRRNHNEKD